MKKHVIKTDKVKSKKQLVLKPRNFHFSSKLKNIQLLFLFNLILVFCICMLVGLCSKYYALKNPDLSLILPWLRGDVSPKPFEKFAFILSVLAVPIFTLLCLYTRYTKFYIENKPLNFLPIIITLFFLLCLLFMPLFDWPVETDINLYFLDLILNGVKAFDLYPIIFFVASWFLVLFVIYIKISNKDNVIRARTGLLSKLSLPLLLAFSIFVMSAWRIYSISTVTRLPAHAIHLDAIMYPLQQVVMGKTLLADLPSQYGLYPEFLLPIFKLVPLTVLNFTLVMGVLQVFALWALFIVLNKMIYSKKIVWLGGVALIVLTFSNSFFYRGYTYDSYFQYWPIRFLWPAISLLLFYKYLTNKSYLKSIIFSVASAVAVLWNMDTGLFIFLSYTFYLLIKAININFIQDRTLVLSRHLILNKKFALTLLLHTVVTLLVFCVFFLILRLKSHQELHFAWLFMYQKVFYATGFFMLPIPKAPHPWMAVAGIYIYGIVYALFSQQKTSSLKSDFILYLSILGIGIFLYYEGRSHVYNLLNVLWPALVIGLILSNDALRCLKLKLINPINILLPATFMTLVFICNLIFICNVPYTLQKLIQQFETRGIPLDPIVPSDIKFIQEYSGNDKNCLLLSKHQGVYSAELGLISPVNGPGLI